MDKYTSTIPQKAGKESARQHGSIVRELRTLVFDLTKSPSWCSNLSCDLKHGQRLGI